MHDVEFEKLNISVFVKNATVCIIATTRSMILLIAMFQKTKRAKYTTSTSTSTSTLVKIFYTTKHKVATLINRVVEQVFFKLETVTKHKMIPNFIEPVSDKQMIAAFGDQSISGNSV